jgi:hypothetical protein
VAVLPYSQFTYVEPCLDMKENTWLLCNVHMFEYWGGTTTRIVCDNLKTGVVSHPKEGEIVLNEAYEALGNYYMTAIMPTQIRKPKHQAHAECQFLCCAYAGRCSEAARVAEGICGRRSR